MHSISYLITHPNYLASRMLVKYFTWLPDKLFQILQFRFSIGYWPDFKNTQTFSEKLQWLKLYDRRPEYTVMVDKVKAKEYVASILGEEYIIPTLGVWKDPEEIDFDALPDRFVLKCNHNSGLGMYICRDKSKMDVEQVKKELRKGLKENYFKHNREWPYKDVPRRILAEAFVEPEEGKKDLSDYKWYCFNGEPKFCQVIQDRNTVETIDFFDTNWIHQDFIGLDPIALNAEIPPVKPVNLETHLKFARALSKGIPFSRIDLYESNNHTYFGEITFFPGSGLGNFRPNHYNHTLGSMINLPNSK